MENSEFEAILELLKNQLNQHIQTEGKFKTSKQFEDKIRDLLIELGILSDRNASAQAFPDIAVGRFGIEVKLTESDNWRCIANSISEGQRVPGVEVVYLLYGKMGGKPEVRWGHYGDCVVHVRTTHRLRFEVSMEPDKKNLFEEIGTTYEQFRQLSEAEKMVYIRKYARKRRKPGEFIWWLES